jgi:hypothetical protein
MSNPLPNKVRLVVVLLEKTYTLFVKNTTQLSNEIAFVGVLVTVAVGVGVLVVVGVIV